MSLCFRSAALCAALSVAPGAYAQLALTGAPVQENFNTLAASGTSSTLPTGWAFSESGTNANTLYAASDGSNQSGDTYSAGTGTSTERALGALQSNSLASRFGVHLQNQTGNNIAELTIAYFGEQWRLGALGRVDRLDFQYSLDATSLTTGTWIDVDQLDFIAPVSTGTVGPLDGNVAANRSAIEHTITGLSIATSQNFWLRWVDFNPAGADDLLAIDDVVISTTGGVDVPPTVNSTVPADQATGVAPSSNINVQFSEAVTTAPGWFQLSCSVSGNPAVQISGSGSSRVIDPDQNFAFGESCTATVVAALVEDLDGTPDQMVANYVFVFTVAEDLPPSVQSTIPADGAGAVSVGSTIIVQFSEPVTVTAPWFGIACSVSGSVPASFSGGPQTYTIDPDQDFEFSEACTVTILASQVIDQDGTPQAMQSNYVFGFTTAPEVGDYYQSVDASSAASLRTTLHALIRSHTVYPYSGGTVNTWTILELADEDPNNSGRILDVYKNRSYQKVADRAGTGSGVTYNREHTWPNSLGFPSTTGNLSLPNAPYTDAHMLYLSDTDYNGARGNRPFANPGCIPVGNCTEYSTEANNGQGGGGTGVYPGTSNWRRGDNGNQGSFEPWNFRKGDLARALFYMVVRYEGGVHGITGQSEPKLELTNNRSQIVATSNCSPACYMGLLDDLIAWHNADPPDARERLRNDVVYSFQLNRNPFIDHPEWVACLFLDQCSANPLIFANGFED